jgi:hypothetical protein
MYGRWRGGATVAVLALGLAACGSSGRAATTTSSPALAGTKAAGIVAIGIQTSDGPAWCRSLGTSLPLRQLASALEVRLDGSNEATARAVLMSAADELRADALDARNSAGMLDRAASALAGLARPGTVSSGQAALIESTLGGLGKATQTTCHFPTGTDTRSSTTTTAVASS